MSSADKKKTQLAVILACRVLVLFYIFAFSLTLFIAGLLI